MSTCDVAAIAPIPIDYDWERRIAYLRLLDADGDCANWCEAIGLVIEG